MGGKNKAGIRVERLPKRAEASCVAVIKERVQGKNQVLWALGQKGIETLICGIHLQRFEAHSEEIGRLEKLMDYGFSLKRRKNSDDPHNNNSTHSGFDDALVALFVVHVPANKVRKLDKALESVGPLRVVQRKTSEDHLFIVTERVTMTDELSEEEMLEEADQIRKNRENSEKGDVIGAELKEKLDEQAFYESNLERTDDPETNADSVTGLENLELPPGGIEEGKTDEATAELADEPIEIGRRDEGFVRRGFKCPRCEEVTSREKEPYQWENPNCSRENICSIHPHSMPEVEEALKNNYGFMPGRESVKKNKTPIVYMYAGDQWVKRSVEGFIKEKAAQLRPRSAPGFWSKVFKNPDFGEFKIMRRTDPVLAAPNGKIERLFEVKSTKSLKHQRNEPSNHRVMQIHPYTAGLDLNSCTTVHVEKNGLEFLSHEVPFDKSTYREGMDRVKGLHSALTNNKPPEAEPFGERECKLCPYSEECLGGESPGENGEVS